MNTPVKIALVVGIIVAVGYYIQSSERAKIELEQEQKVQETREAIRDAIEDSRPVDDNDATDSLQYLRGRN